MKHMRFAALLLALVFLFAPSAAAAETGQIAENILACLDGQENPRHPQSPAEHDLVRKLSREQNADGSFGQEFREHITSIIALELTDPYAYDRDRALIHLCGNLNPTDPELTAYALSALQFFRGDRIAESAIAWAVGALRPSVENAATLPCQTLSAMICGLTAIEADLNAPDYTPLIKAFAVCPQDTIETERAAYALQTGSCPYWAIARSCQIPETVFADTIADAEIGAAMVRLYNKGVIIGRPARNAAADAALTTAELLVMLDRMLPEDRADRDSHVWYAAALDRFSVALAIDHATFDPSAVVSDKAFSAITETILLPKYADVGLPAGITSADPAAITRGEAALYLAAVGDLTVKP
ncbi:MAG: hypothetical protein E7452_01180 [Ruminococcaceae bacterium]|nr:hypothetical protein [Oscillospiraceae bacterium]